METLNLYCAYSVALKRVVKKGVERLEKSKLKMNATIRRIATLLIFGRVSEYMILTLKLRLMQVDEA